MVLAFQSACVFVSVKYTVAPNNGGGLVSDLVRTVGRSLGKQAAGTPGGHLAPHVPVKLGQSWESEQF